MSIRIINVMDSHISHPYMKYLSTHSSDAMFINMEPLHITLGFTEGTWTQR